MIAYPNCKINLGLNITDRRNDAYHNIETVFYPINLQDILEIIIAKDGKTEFNSSGIFIPGDPESNLCVKAYNLLSELFKLPAIKIHLHKMIPIGAGLGGGSSDSAFTLQMLNQMFDLKISKIDLQNFAAKLGADCPFFIKNKASFAKGIGNEFEDISIDLKDYFIVLLKPKIHINTAEAYSQLQAVKRNPSVEEVIKMPISDWKEKLKNDFERNIFISHPEIKKIKDSLYELGAAYASMSGSGSAVYGLFEDEIQVPKDLLKYFLWQNKL